MKRFWRDNSGVAYVEFAITLPFLAAMILGGVEMTRYILITQKIEKVSVTVSDIVAQESTIGTASLNRLIEAAGEVMQPYSFGNNAYVIISSVYRNGTNAPLVNWQYTGGGSWIKSSQIGSPGNVATLPSGFTMRDKENIIVAEVFYQFQPLLSSAILPTKQIYKFAIFKPRLGDLTTLGQ